MRKFLSILLLSLLGLPFASALMAASAPPGANLPICCRRDGKHQCAGAMEGMAGEASGQTPGVKLGVLTERCPWHGAASVRAQHETQAGPVERQGVGLVPTGLRLATSAAVVRGYRRRARRPRGPPVDFCL